MEFTELTNESAVAHKKGMSCLKREDYANAIKEFSEAIRLTKKDEYREYDENDYLCRGFCYFMKKEHDNAISNLTESLKIGMFCESYYYRSKAYIEKGEYEKALSDAQKSLEFRPKWVKAQKLVEEYKNKLGGNL